MGLRAGHLRGPIGLRSQRVPRAIIGLGVATVLLGIVVAFGTSTLEVYRLEREAAELDRTKHQLQEQNALLHEEIKLLYTSPYIERIAREQLGLVKSGEIALLIVRPPSPPPPIPSRPPEQMSWVARLWRTLTGAFSR